MSIPSILRAAADRLDGGRAWCHGHIALDTAGEVCDATSERAVKWCAYGAIVAVASDRTERWDAACAVEDYLDVGTDLATWNDAYAEDGATVVARLREAADRLSAAMAAAR